MKYTLTLYDNHWFLECDWEKCGEWHQRHELEDLEDLNPEDTLVILNDKTRKQTNFKPEQ